MFKRVWKLGLAGIPALIMLLWAGWVATPASVQAQSGSILVDKQLGRSNPVVYVGEYLTFTIHIRNDTSFTIVTLPLDDQYNAAVLRYKDASIAADVVNEAAGLVTWLDLTTSLGDFPPGREVTLIVGFIAEHPQPAVVNEAEVRAAVLENGDIIDGGHGHGNADAIGGSAPIEKSMLEGLTPQVGDLITFTIVLTNTGYITMTRATLVDTYDPTMMSFYYAAPPPDIVDAVTGVLTWTNIAAQVGGIPGRSTLTIITVFTATSASATLVNHAQIVAAGDWYDNDMEGGADDVPIIIIDRPTTPTPETPAPTARPQATPTPAPTLTVTPIIPLLPETGPDRVLPWGGGVLLGGLLLLAMLAVQELKVKR